jgi:hypothetical protein
VDEASLPSAYRDELQETIKASYDNELFLTCLRERNRQERPVSESPASRTYAALVFSQMPESKGIGRARLEAALDRLFRIGAIERGFVGRINRKDKEGLRETCADLCADPAPTVCADVRSAPAPTCAVSHPIPKGISGAAHGPTAPQTDDIIWDNRGEAA